MVVTILVKTNLVKLVLNRVLISSQFLKSYHDLTYRFVAVNLLMIPDLEMLYFYRVKYNLT